MVRFRTVPRNCWMPLLALSLTLAGSADAATRTQRAPTTLDNDDRMNRNMLDMAVTNHGSIAFDLTTAGPGLIYPNGTSKAVVFAAGLWIGAKVNGNTLVSVSDYDQEFAPGPLSAGGTDSPQYRNYRIDQGGAGYSDYLTNAVPLGAPVDSLGNPYLLGDALIWSLFNDGDSNRHIVQAGSTAPLGVEVQQSVFAFARAGALGNTVFVKWRLENKGGLQLDSMYVSLWVDPDVGDASDDLAGCDTTLSLGYAYNESNLDAVYGTTPPAVGFHMLQGAKANGVDLSMTSFVHFVNGADPMDALETYHCMSGRHKDGSPLHICDDPSLPATRYAVSGDPTLQQACPGSWVDVGGNDRRLLMSTGPFVMDPGDTQIVIVAIEVGQGSSALSSVSQLRNVAATIRTVFEPTTAVESYVVDSRAEAGAIHLAWYVPASTGTPITIERRTTSGVWISRTETTLPSGGVLRYDDTDIVPGESYGYRLVVWSGGAQDYSDETWIKAAPADETPSTLRLMPGRPNPSSASFQIRHYVPRRGAYRLAVADVHGRVIRVLSDREFMPGWYESTWDGRDRAGHEAASGTYFLRIEGEGAAETRKLVLTR